MGEDVQAAAVGHAELERRDPVRGSLPGELVEQRHQRVEAFERERLLAGKDLAQVLLERLRAHQPFEERAFGGRVERAAMASALDFLSQPDTLLATCDVLDLIGDRAAVGVVEARQHVCERLAWRADAQHVGGDARELGLRQRRAQLRRVQRRVADRLGCRAGRAGQRDVHACGAPRRALSPRRRSGTRRRQGHVRRGRRRAPCRSRRSTPAIRPARWRRRRGSARTARARSRGCARRRHDARHSPTRRFQMERFLPGAGAPACRRSRGGGQAALAVAPDSVGRPASSHSALPSW